ncbi:MAG: 4-hydroxy-tetrahydrodipicolinate synthase [Actinomycetota bacterium]
MAFGRLLTAMVTPFNPDESVNHEAAAQLARFLVDHGSDGIVVSGTTGESPTLTTDEKLALFRTVKEAVGDRASVIAGTGNYCTRESVELTQAAEAVGVDGAMLVVPYYNNPPQEGLYQHFRKIAESTALPIILYNVPSRSPRNMEAATVIRLAEIANVVAVKEASGKIEQITEIIARTPASFQVYSGDDAYTLPLMSMGAYGIISVAGHLCGSQIKQMIEAFVAGRVTEAAELHGRLMPLFNACFCTTNPIPVKAGVNLLGIPAGGVRLPMIPADEKVTATIRTAMQDLGVL